MAFQPQNKNIMNVCIVSGRLLKNAVARGTEAKTLTFTIENRYGSNGGEGNDKVTYVPCVMFNPAPEIEAILTTKGQDLQVEFEGRITGSNPEKERRFNTEVIVRNKSLMILGATA